MKKIIDTILIMARGVKEMKMLSPWNLTIKIIRAFTDAALPFVNLYLSAVIIDSMIAGASFIYLMQLVGITVSLNIVLLIISDLMSNFNYVMWWMLFPRFYMRLSNKVLSLRYEDIEDPKTSEMVKKIDDAVKVFDNGLFKVHSQIPNFMQSLFSLIFSSYFIISIIFIKGPNPTSTLQSFANSDIANIILVVLLILTTIISSVSNSKIISKTFNTLNLYSKLGKVFEYYINNYLDAYKAGKDTRLYKQNKVIESEIKSFNKNGGKLVGEANFINFKYTGLSNVINLLLTVFAYSFVGLKSLAGAFGVGSILKFAGSILQFSTAFSAMVDACSKSVSNYPHISAYFKFIDLKEDSETGSIKINKKLSNYVIEFDNVSYQYPGSSEYAVKDLSFVISSGKRMAVVGENGSGKTTMIKLMCRMCYPTNGVIKLNGKNINEYNYFDYLNIIGVVFQDFKLFAFPLGENVTSSVEYPDNVVENILKKAGFEDALRKMSGGLNTYIYKDFNEKGVNVSGGEALKIALARALYKNTPFLILDEPTAALDPIAENEIFTKFNEIAGNKTVIFISHRLSSCKFCDEIFVFNKGNIIQRGDHDSLLKNTDGKYHKLWHAQAQHYVDYAEYKELDYVRENN